MNGELRSKIESYNKTASVDLEPSYLERPKKLIELFRKYNIRSVFDSGCKDRHWIKYLDFASINITYIGGDISLPLVKQSKNLFPELNIIHHDCTTDPIPKTDLVFSSDVMIHLSNSDKLKFLQNFIASDVKFLLMTDSGYSGKENISPDYNEHCPFAHVSWKYSPWNFPEPLDTILDHEQTDRSLKLWHRDQLIDVIKKIKL